MRDLTGEEMNSKGYSTIEVIKTKQGDGTSYIEEDSIDEHKTQDKKKKPNKKHGRLSKGELYVLSTPDRAHGFYVRNEVVYRPDRSVSFLLGMNLKDVYSLAEMAGWNIIQAPKNVRFDKPKGFVV